MKIIKFPEHKIKRPWLRKMQNLNKSLLVNTILSFTSVIVGLTIVWFILRKINT